MNLNNNNNSKVLTIGIPVQLLTLSSLPGRPADMSWEERDTNSTSSGSDDEGALYNQPEVRQREVECKELHAQMPLPDPALGEYMRAG